MENISYTYKFEGLRWIHPDGKLSYEPTPEVTEQFRAYGRHYNARIEIARASRNAYREARKEIVPEFEEAETKWKEADQEVKRIRLEVKALRKEARRRAEGTELRARLTAAVQAKKAASIILKAAREQTKSDPKLKKKSEDLHQQKLAAEREARSKTPADWGTYLKAEDASSKAGSSSHDPRFRAWSIGLPTTVTPPCPEGTIAVQIQKTKPLTVLGLFTQIDTRIRLAPPKGNPKRPAHSHGWIKIGRAENKPVWAEFEVRVRRAMPPEARITWAWITRKRVGIRWENTLYIGVEQPAHPVRKDLDDVLAVDINMRIVKGGIRVGYSYNGQLEIPEEHIIPEKIINKLEHARSVRSIQDREFNLFRDELTAWLKTAKVPSWLTEKTKFLPQWRSSNRLSAVVIHWRDNRFSGDHDIYLRAEQWRAQNRHLYDYWFNDDRNARDQRQEIYRSWANEWFQGYGTIVVAAWNWSQIARRPQPEDDNNIPEAVRSMRFNVAPSELIKAIEQAARSRGARAIRVQLEPVGCLHCESSHLSENKEKGSVLCLDCGKTMVRDEMQARGLYAARERFLREENDSTARE
jgi:hypothetical protein